MADHYEKKLKEIEHDFSSAVSKAPSADGKNLVRVTANYNAPSVGDSVTFGKYTSFSSEPNDLLYERFSYPGTVVYNLTGTSSFKDISKIGDATTDSENEVVNEKASSFKVASVKECVIGGEETWLGTVGGHKVTLVTLERDNDDGGPGSGNFGHEGRPGKVGGAAGSETTQTAKTLSHGSSKNFQSLIPSDSYTNTTDYQNASKAFKSALKKRNEINDKQNAVKKELESETRPKPRSEWTEDDEIYDMLGDRPMVYTDKGKELKAQSDKLFKEWSAADHEFTEAGDRLRDIKKKAHDEQIKSVNFDKPVKASSDDYEGFTTKTTGTGYDEYLNGKQSDGYIAEMSPAEYLKRCAYQVFENATIESTLAAINEKNVDEYAKKMESGEKFDMPYLNLKKGEQEGRHRAAAAMKAGIEKIPVLVVGYKQNTDSADTHGSVGVLVIKDGRILCGIRSGNTAPGCICGPGGHIENGETPEQAAIRETQEEFGITPKDLVPIGNGPAESDTGYSPNLFLCTDYEGEPNCTSNEMSWAQFVDLDKFADNPPSMFQPFADSIICLLNAMSGDDHEDGVFFARELDDHAEGHDQDDDFFE